MNYHPAEMQHAGDYTCSGDVPPDPKAATKLACDTQKIDALAKQEVEEVDQVIKALAF